MPASNHVVCLKKTKGQDRKKKISKVKPQPSGTMPASNHVICLKKMKGQEKEKKICMARPQPSSTVSASSHVLSCYTADEEVDLLRKDGTLRHCLQAFSDLTYGAEHKDTLDENNNNNNNK